MVEGTMEVLEMGIGLGIVQRMAEAGSRVFDGDQHARAMGGTPGARGNNTREKALVLKRTWWI